MHERTRKVCDRSDAAQCGAKRPDLIDVVRAGTLRCPMKLWPA
jgi:hypothetical protein